MLSSHQISLQAIMLCSHVLSKSLHPDDPISTVLVHYSYWEIFFLQQVHHFLVVYKEFPAINPVHIRAIL